MQEKQDLYDYCVELYKNNLDDKSINITSLSKKYNISYTTLRRKILESGIEIINKTTNFPHDSKIFKKIDTEEKAYWLGFLYADGCMTSERNRVQIILNGKDKKHLEKFRDFLGYSEKDRPIKAYYDNSGYFKTRFSFRDEQIYNDLLNLGCIPNKSLILTFPSENQVPKDFITPFIRGYIDGDGYIGTVKKDNNIYARFGICGTENFILTCCEKLNWKQNKLRKSGKIYVMEWQGKYAKQYVNDLYDNAKIYLDRKYEIVNKMPYK